MGHPWVRYRRVATARYGQRRRGPRSHRALFLAALFTFLPALGGAQTGIVAGIVVTEGSGSPVAGAQVQVEGTTLGALSDVAGRFRIAGLTGSQVTLDVRRIGFRPTRQTASVGDLGVRIEITERAIELDQVVVTGTPGATEKRAIGNSIATIDASEITEKTQVNSLQELLNGRAAGVVIMPATGAVGSGSRIRIRGSGSFSLSNQPLIYVDGIRINSDPTTGPVNQGFGSQSISRINDINPEEIESIEILKGPAAATLYGTEASNGVIQIITKRGSSSQPRWNLTVKQGGNYLRDPEGRFETNYQVDADDNVLSIDIVERENDRGTPIFTTGHLQEVDLSVAGGTALATYYLAGGYEDSEGVEPSNGLRRYSTRVNLGLNPSEQIGVNANLGYVSGKTDLGCEAGCGGRVWGTVLANPNNLTGVNASRRGFHSGTPEEYDLLQNFSQDIDRFTGSVQLSHNPFLWLRHQVTVGSDRTRETNVAFTPRVDSLIGSPVWGNGPLGGISQTERQINLSTLDYSATATADLTGDIQSATSAGGQYYRTSTEFVFAEGDVFPAPGLTSVDATTQDKDTGHDFFEEKSLGFFVQEQLSWRNRFFL
ncbi:MAG: TonB-dependent receptor plug domain-containing protein, partial [Gemmatimonadaceae bacterium]